MQVPSMDGDLELAEVPFSFDKVDTPVQVGGQLLYDTKLIVRHDAVTIDVRTIGG